jgi:hypothetical protein
MSGNGASTSAEPYPRKSGIDWTATRHFDPIERTLIPTCCHSLFRAIWYDFHRLQSKMAPRVGRSVVGSQCTDGFGIPFTLAGYRSSPWLISAAPVEDRIGPEGLVGEPDYAVDRTALVRPQTVRLDSIALTQRPYLLTTRLAPAARRRVPGLQRAERPFVASGHRGVCPCSAVSLDCGTGGDQRAQLCGTLR